MDEYEIRYGLYLGLAESFEFEPLQYEEWLEREKKYEEDD